MPLHGSRIAWVTLGLLAAAGCGGRTTSATPKPPATSQATEVPTAGASTPDPAVAACDAKPSNYPDILVREKDPTRPYAAQQLGGNYAYNYRTNKCEDGVTYALSTVADLPGYCVQVAEASDNPGYNPDASPAPRLKKVVASKGSAC